MQVRQGCVQALSLSQNATQNPLLVGIETEELLADDGDGVIGGGVHV